MIVDTILDWLEAAFIWLGGLLPAWDPGAFLDNFDLVTSNLAALNYFLPISELFAAVIAVFYLLPAFLGVTLVVWLVALIRGGSARA